MSAINLGIQPEALRVLLTDGADFQCVVVLDEDWPVGATLQLVFNDGAATWNATVTGTNATFDVVAATADAMAHGTAVRLVYTDSDGVQVWGIGTVVRSDD